MTASGQISVTLPSLPISVATSTRFQMVRDAACEGTVTFTISYLFKHAGPRTRAHFRGSLGVSRVGGHERFTAVELMLLIFAALCSDLRGCVQPS